MLIFDITKFNTSLHRFLLKNFKIVGYSSIAFLVSIYDTSNTCTFINTCIIILVLILVYINICHGVRWTLKSGGAESMKESDS